MTNFLCTRIGTLSLYITRSIYKSYLRSKIFSIFPNTRLWFIQKFLYIHSLFSHTRISLHVFFIKTLLCTFISLFFWMCIYASIIKKRNVKNTFFVNTLCHNKLSSIIFETCDNSKSIFLWKKWLHTFLLIRWRLLRTRNVFKK